MRFDVSLFIIVSLKIALLISKNAKLCNCHSAPNPPPTPPPHVISLPIPPLLIGALLTEFLTVDLLLALLADLLLALLAGAGFHAAIGTYCVETIGETARGTGPTVPGDGLLTHIAYYLWHGNSLE